MTVILLSTTPIAGLAALLGMSRFEEWALDENPSQRAAAQLAADSLDMTVDLTDAAIPSEAGPVPVPALHQAA